MRTIVYVDGFNLYYGALRKTPYKWLDLGSLCQRLLPKSNIQTIKYFTARISARDGNEAQVNRQQIYLRALETIPHLEVIYGHFLVTQPTMRLADPPPYTNPFVTVIKIEEKGSDVNIATHMIMDGCQNAYDAAALITNDSDLTEPVRLIRTQLKRTVIVINPHKKPSMHLQRHASLIKPIRQHVLAASQFPSELTDATGVFTKPEGW